MGMHGYPRATDDVDLLTRLPLRAVRDLLGDQGIRATLLSGDILEGACLEGTLGGIRFDVIPPLVSLDWENAVSVQVKGTTIKVVDLDGLYRLKLKAHGPEDLLDVARLVLVHPESRPRARELAQAYGVLDQLDRWLEDARVRAKVKERAPRPRATRRRRRS